MKLTTRSQLVALVLVFVTSAVSAQQPCQPPPLPAVTVSQNIFNAQQESYLGDAVAEQVEGNYHVIDDQEVTAHLREIGERIIKHLPPTSLKFQFFLFDLNDVNAFTMPGGRIYVSRKMVAFAQNEDELAGVIAHELGHIVARHSTIDMTILFREVLGVTQVGDRRDVFDKYHQLIDNAARKPKAFEKLENHEEGNQNVADLIGLYAMVHAGYDPQAQAELWDRYHQLKGKTGGFLADLFGRTKPEQKRLREMLAGLSKLPPECRGPRVASNETNFQQWQARVVSYVPPAGSESAEGLISKKPLTPALRGDISHLRFSPDGKYLLAQDDAGISVMAREPFASLFRIDAPDAKRAQFTPDSSQLVFHTSNLRVEIWDLGEHKLKTAYEVVVRKSCLQTLLAPDGKSLACLDSDFGLSLVDTSNGSVIFEKKSFSQMGFSDAFSLLLSILLEDSEPTDYEFVNMAFSPDGHYFVAGDRSTIFNGLGLATESQSLVIDLATRAAVPLKGDIKKIIASGFAFVGPDKIVGKSIDNQKKSGLYSFPSGQAIENFEMGSSSLSPVTAGSYVLLRDYGASNGALMDLTSRKIFRVNQRPVLDAFNDLLASERANSELGLYSMTGGPPQVLALPQNPLGRLYAADVSPDFKWLALSGYSRGAVWDLSEGKMVLYSLGFRGAFLGDDKIFYADYPKHGDVNRTIARVTLGTNNAEPGPPIENDGARQFGPVVIQFKPGKKDGGYWENVIMEILDVRTMTPSWSIPFPKERPRYWLSGRGGAMILLWPLASKAASDEIKANPVLAKQQGALKEKEGDYLVKVIDLANKAPIGEFLIETGKGSFRIRDIIADGERVAISDNQNRTLVYSASTGQELGKTFGSSVAISAAGNLLCIENKGGLLELYDLTSFEKRRQYSFGGRLSLVRFSADGKRLFVVTANQNVYLLDVSAVSSVKPE